MAGRPIRKKGKSPKKPGKEWKTIDDSPCNPVATSTEITEPDKTLP